MGRAKIEEQSNAELERLNERFRDIYNGIRDSLEAKHHGKYVVINILTSQHVIARWPEEAMEMAQKVFGTTEYCWSKRIGTP